MRKICSDNRAQLTGSGAAEIVFTMNLDHVVKMRKDAAFREVYGRAGLITADGFPIVLACRLQGK
jgi:N-acetylglucosaminyldiphosphoundecaprenol N-acetyl-beta-D-mannosaminyltransferase